MAFPQYGVLADPGTAELLDEALRNGVEVIGGIDPAGADHDPVRHLDIVFALAEKHGAPGSTFTCMTADRSVPGNSS